MTLGLALIMKDEIDDLERILKDYSQYFDKIFLTCTDSAIHKKLKKMGLPVELSYFKWIDHFGKAREFNRKQITTDFWFWCDLDDTIIGGEYLRETAKFMQENKIDISYMKYDYYQDEAGNPTNTHDRERLIRTKADVKWSDVPVHETCENPDLKCASIGNISVRHRLTAEELEQATKRNAELLKKHWSQKKDPRTAYYLGLTYGMEEKWDKSIEMFKFSLSKGWPDQQADVWNKLAEVYYRKGDYAQALDATDMALRILPADPVPYYYKVAVYMALEELDKALEWGKVAVTKPPLNSMFPVDSTLTSYRGPYMVYQVCKALGAEQAAQEILAHITKTAPHFLESIGEPLAVPKYNLI